MPGGCLQPRLGAWHGLAKSPYALLSCNKDSCAGRELQTLTVSRPVVMLPQLCARGEVPLPHVHAEARGQPGSARGVGQQHRVDIRHPSVVTRLARPLASGAPLQCAGAKGSSSALPADG